MEAAAQDDRIGLRRTLRTIVRLGKAVPDIPIASAVDFRTVARTALWRVPLSLFEVKRSRRAVSALSSIFLPWTPVRDRSGTGTHAGEAPSSCCTAPASPPLA